MKIPDLNEAYDRAIEVREQASRRGAHGDADKLMQIVRLIGQAIRDLRAIDPDRWTQ